MKSSNLSETAWQYITDAIKHYRNQHYQDALEAFELAIKLDPTSVKALHGRGIVLVQMKEYKKALDSYEQASRLAPNISQIYADMAELFYKLRDYKKSYLSYKKAIELDSKYEDVYRDKAKNLVDKAFKLIDPWTRDKAIAAYKRVLLFNPDDNTRSELSKLQRIKATLSQRTSSDVHPCNCRCPMCINY